MCCWFYYNTISISCSRIFRCFPYSFIFRLLRIPFSLYWHVCANWNLHFWQSSSTQKLMVFLFLFVVSFLLIHWINFSEFKFNLSVSVLSTWPCHDKKSYIGNSFLIEFSECSGLNVEVDRILEIACIITDGKLTKSVEVLLIFRLHCLYPLLTLFWYICYRLCGVLMSCLCKCCLLLTTWNSNTILFLNLFTLIVI